MPAASFAVKVTEKAVPAVAPAGALSVKWSSAPEPTVAGAAALVELQECQMAVTV